MTESAILTEYEAHHKRILDLKVAVGQNFWSLGEELLRMQRQCADCGYLPIGESPE